MIKKIYNAIGIEVLSTSFLKENAHDIPGVSSSSLYDIKLHLSDDQFGSLLNNLILIELFNAPALSPYDWSPSTLSRDVLRSRSTDSKFVYKLDNLLNVSMVNGLLTQFSIEYVKEALRIYYKIRKSKVLEPNFILNISGSEAPSSSSTFWEIEHNLIMFMNLMETQLFELSNFRSFIDDNNILISNPKNTLMLLCNKLDRDAVL